MMKPFITQIRNKNSSDHISLGIIGDVSFHNINKPNVALFAQFISFFKSTDIVVANVETVVSNRELKPAKKRGVLLKSSSCTAKILKEIGVTNALLANNHIDDYGKEGIDDTINNLEAVGIKPFGVKGYEELIIEKNNIRLQLCGFVTPYEKKSGYLIPYGKSLKEISTVIHNNTNTKLIYFLHGFEELFSTPFPWRVNLLKRISQKVSPSALICGHQHVYQGYILNNNVPICLSYGNGFMHIDYHKQNIDTNTGCYSVLHFDKIGCYQIDEYFFNITIAGVVPINDDKILTDYNRINNSSNKVSFEKEHKTKWREECYKKYKFYKINKNNRFINAIYHLYRLFKLSNSIYYIHYRSMFFNYLHKMLCICTKKIINNI